MESIDSDVTFTKKPYKCILIGEPKTGKSVFLRRHIDKTFRDVYEPTPILDVQVVSFLSTVGRIEFEIWDTAGNEVEIGLNKSYFKDADCVMIMFDLTCPSTIFCIFGLYDDIISVKPDMPVVFVGNKCDIYDESLNSPLISRVKKYGKNYFEISTKTLQNIENPFEELSIQLTGDPTLKFIKKNDSPDSEAPLYNFIFDSDYDINYTLQTIYFTPHNH